MVSKTKVLGLTFEVDMHLGTAGIGMERGLREYAESSPVVSRGASSLLALHCFCEGPYYPFITLCIEMLTSLSPFTLLQRAQFASMLLDAGLNIVDPRGRLLPRSYDILGDVSQYLSVLVFH